MSWRKGSNASVETSGGSNGSRTGGPPPPTKGEYPFALGLRIRVVQVVCAIGAVVMGSVAAIEERHNFNLSLGVPGGAITVMAASWSIHRSLYRNAGGRRGGAWLSRILWILACFMNAALLTLAILTVIRRKQHGESYVSNTSLALALIQGFFASSTLVAEGLSARLRWIHGPPPSGMPPRGDRCPYSTSHTAVSMVPLASTCAPSASDSNNTGGDSANEMMLINVADNKVAFEDINLSPSTKTGQK